MKMVLFLLVWGVLLVHTSTAQNENPAHTEISFENFCTNFDGLRILEHNLQWEDMERDLESIREQLVANNVVPDTGTIDALEEICSDPSKAFDTECLYRFRYLMTIRNQDFNNFNTIHQEGLYVDIFLLHPMFRSCLPFVNKDVQSNDVKSRIAAGLAGDNPEEFSAVLDTRSGVVLRKEIADSCENKAGDPTFCQLLPELVKMVDNFEAIKTESTTSFKWNAFRLNFVMLKHNNPDEFQQVHPRTVDKLNDVLVQNLEHILQYIGNGQIAELTELMSFVPDLKTIKSGCETLWNLPSNTKKNECMFWKAIIQISVYLQSTKPPASGIDKKILNTNIDYPTFLSLTEMERIREIVQNQETAQQELVQWLNSELTNTVNERFIGLRSYFGTVETFNREKARADLDYINTRVSTYTTKIGSLSIQLGGKLNEILTLAITAVSLEVAEDIIQVGLAAAVLINPLEKLFGGSSAGDFIDRSAKLAKTLTTVGALIPMTRSFNTLKDQTIDISSRFQNNANFLENVRTLITTAGQDTSTADFEARKQRFLNDYKAYDPEVQKPELTGMTTMWENLIDDSCDVILDTDNALAQTVVAYVRSSGLRQNTRVLAQEMIETYAEIYDFQFELIEAMATYMRALTSLNAAASITAGYEESSSEGDGGGSVVDDLKVLTVVSYISYKTNIWQITEAYCDILEYKEGGVRPTVCKGINTNIANLVSRASPACRNVEANKDVPTTPDPAESADGQAFMNMTDLYSEKRVTFKIPNGQWLVNNQWIHANDRDSAIFVKKFEVFLPIESDTKRRVRVEAKITGRNQHMPPNGKSYVIVPDKTFIFEYYEGRDALAACRRESDALTNPYDADLPKICPLSVGIQERSLYPSVYSQWEVLLYGYLSATVPVPETILNLKVGMQLCILERSRQGKKRKDKMKRTKKAGKKKKKKMLEDATSCPDGQYWSEDVNGCASCPEGSRTALRGYYCEKIPKKN